MVKNRKLRPLDFLPTVVELQGVVNLFNWRQLSFQIQVGGFEGGHCNTIQEARKHKPKIGSTLQASLHQRFVCAAFCSVWPVARCSTTKPSHVNVSHVNLAFRLGPLGSFVLLLQQESKAAASTLTQQEAASAAALQH